MKHIKTYSLFEGNTLTASKKKDNKKFFEKDQKVSFREKIESHLSSQGIKYKKVGNDLEIDCDGIVQIMFRPDYIGIKKSGNKFVDEYKYTELGKIKSEISIIIKNKK